MVVVWRSLCCNLSNINSVVILIEYEEFPVEIDVLGSWLYSLFHDHWQEVGVGHIVYGSVLELEFAQAPKIIRLYDGYWSVVTEGWHMHLCIEENQGEPTGTAPDELRQKRSVSRDVDVIHSGCLVVCKLGSVVLYSRDQTWYTCVTPELTDRIVQNHLGQGHKIESNLYPSVKKS